MSNPRKSNRLSDVTKPITDEELAERLAPSVVKLAELIKANAPEEIANKVDETMKPHETASTRIETAVKEAEQTRIRNSTPLPYRFCVSHFMATFQLVAIFKGASVVHAYLIDTASGEVKNSDKNPAIMAQARADNKGSERACTTAMALPEMFYDLCTETDLASLAKLCVNIPHTAIAVKAKNDELAKQTETPTTNADGSMNLDNLQVTK